MNKALLALTVGLGTALASLPAAAQLSMSGFYVGAGVGQGKAKDFCGGGPFDSCDDKETAWKIFGGYQFTPNFAAEVGYGRLGKFNASLAGLTDEVKVTVWEASALAAWPIVQQLSVFGRLGLYRATAKETTNFAGDFDHDNNDWTFGLGLQYDVTR